MRYVYRLLEPTIVQSAYDAHLQGLKNELPVLEVTKNVTG